MKRRRPKPIQIPFKTWTATVEITAEEIEEAQKDPEKFIDDFLDLIGAPWAKEEKDQPSVIYAFGMKVFALDCIPEGEVWIVKPPVPVKLSTLKRKRKDSPV